MVFSCLLLQVTTLFILAIAKETKNTHWSSVPLGKDLVLSSDIAFFFCCLIKELENQDLRFISGQGLPVMLCTVNVIETLDF